MNKAQKEYNFIVIDPIENLGEPDDNEQYPFKYLVSQALKRLDPKKNELIVGITSNSITGEYFSDVDPPNRVIIISLNDMKVYLEDADRDFEDYVILEVSGNIAEYEHAKIYPQSSVIGICGDPWHRETRGCLFDYCNRRSDIVEKLRHTQVENICRGRWIEKQLSQDKLCAVESLVKEAVKTKFSKAIKEILAHPVSGFLYGGVTIGSFNTFIQQTYGDSSVLYLFIGNVVALGVSIGIFYTLKIKMGFTRKH